MARELHDVVAHSVSVIVVQTTGARRVMSTDTNAALKALAAVEAAGREALVELRRMVGILRRGDFVSEDLVTPGLGHLRRLVDQARDAGLAVDLAIEGVVPAMSSGLELAIYRVVQEGLTNTIKHAGPATARVTLLFTAHSVTVEVCDDGAGSGIACIRPSGHGLIGLRERAHLYGGTLRAGPRTTAGFEVRASFPFNGEEPTHCPTGATAPLQIRAKRWPALDPVFAAGFLLLLEITTLTAHVQGGVRYRDVVAVAAMTATFAWRRRQPLLFVIIVVAMGLSLSNQVAPQTSVFTAIYVSVVPAYTVAAWEGRMRAGVGLAILAVAPAIHQVMVHQLNVSYAGFLFVIALAWLAGRAVRSRRRRAAALEHTTFLLVTERENQAELAIAGERSRIARELHAVVAQNVAVMIVQAEAARGQIVEDPAGADESLQAIQVTGRQVLSEMRRILGVLRYNNGEPHELSPQPGVDQIHRLLQRWRQDDLQIDLTVRGEPGALSPGIDVAVYRIVEEILNVAAPRSAVAIELKFAGDDIELATDVYPKDPDAWPPASISERVSLCGGELRTDSDRDQRSTQRHLSARLPSGLAAALP